MFAGRSTLFVSAVLLLLSALVNCQLTFSPDWGKRSVGGGSTGFFDASTVNCKSPNEMLLEIFRFVQGKTQIFLDCEHHD